MDTKTFLENFGYIADAPNGLSKIRDLILYFAVQGNLSTQKSTDVPASELITKIANEQKRNSGYKRIINKLNGAVTDAEKNFILPENWEWTRLGYLVLSLTGGGTPSKNRPEYWNGNIPWASVKDLTVSKYLETTIDKITEKGLKESSTNLIPAGRIIVCTRMGLGKVAINSVDVTINQDLKALELPSEVSKDYFFLLYKTLNITGTGMTVSGIRQDALLNMVVALPPLEEQKRIVTKVDQLMALCDQLESQLKQTRTISEKFVEVTVKSLVAT